MTGPRRHDIDALRVLLFSSLILFHIGYLYTDWGGLLNSSYRSPAAAFVMGAVHEWRMPLLFLISGIALRFMRRGRLASPAALMRNRTLRLVLPLIFGLIFVIPIQPYLEASFTHRIEPGFGNFLIHYFTFQPWPRGTFYGSDDGYANGQLWYLQYLWVYTALLIAALPWLDAPAGLALRRRFNSLRGAGLLLVPVLPKFLAGVLLAERFPGTNYFLSDWAQHPIYVSCFLFGFWIGNEDAIWQEIVRLRWQALIVSLAAFPAALVIDKLAFNHDRALLPAAIFSGLMSIYAWAAILAALGWSARLLNRPFRWLPYASQAIFPWYVLHQSVIVITGYVLIPLHVGPGLEPALVLLATLAVCGLSHEFLIRRHALIRPLFGMKPLAGASRPASAATLPGEVGVLPRSMTR